LSEIFGVLMPAVISLIIGILILQKSSILSMTSKKVLIPIGYFLGLSIHIVFIMLADSIIKDFQASLYLILLLEIIYISVNINLVKALLKRGYAAYYLKFFFAICLTYIFLYLFWTSKYNAIATGTYGTLHSYRYAWISNVIVQCEVVPNVGQNIGQSLLTAISSTLSGTQIPYLYLGTWLSISLVMLVKLIINLLIQIGVDNKSSKIAAMLFVFLGCSLSFNYVSVVDSGYPLIMNGYTDTLLGTAIFLILCYALTKKQEVKMNKIDSFLLFTMFSCNYFVAPQNILILVLFFSLSLSLLKLHSYPEFHNLKTKVITFIFASIMSIPLGGFFSPANFRSKVNIPGVEVINKLSFDFLPGYPFAWNVDKKFFVQKGEDLIMQLLETLQNSNSSIQDKLIAVMDLITFNFIALALPILGFVLLVAFRNKLKDFLQEFRTSYSPSLMAIWVLVISIILQMTIPLFFRISGYKWELTRFAIPFFIIGNLVVSVIAVRSLLKNSIKGYILVGITIVALIGPLKHLELNILSNINNFEEIFKQEANFGPGPEIEQLLCKFL